MEEKITLQELLKKSNCFKIELMEVEIFHETKKKEVVNVSDFTKTNRESITKCYSLKTEIFQFWEDNKTLYIMILV